MANKFSNEFYCTAALVLAVGLANVFSLQTDCSGGQCALQFGKRNNKCRQCPQGWDKYRDNCYFFSTSLTNWITAQEECNGLGGYLVEIDSCEENTMLRRLGFRTNGTHWMGGTYVHTTGKWTWAMSNREFTYDDWAGGQPYNQYTSSCLGNWYNANFHWAAFPCNATLAYICKRRC